MKQHITAKQWKSLSNKGQNKWNEWCKKQGYEICYDGYLDQPDVGKMIHFLDESKEIKYDTKYPFILIEWRGNKGLCNCLWQAVKEILEK